jgi:preprotein translocase subunit SecF
MFIIKYKKIFIGISIILVLLSIASLFVFGLKIGIDFKGGALSEVIYKDSRPSAEELREAVKKLDLGEILIQPTGELGYILKSKDLSEAEHSKLLGSLGFEGKYQFEEKSFNSIGPSVGTELRRKAVISMILVALAIILFITYAFRKVSRPVASWKYGLIAIVTLFHDVLIPVGIFGVFSRNLGAEVDTLFVVAILTILGLSVSDTIVVFDRIRENLKNKVAGEFPEIVGMSLKQTFARSISTSLTVIVALLSLFFFGPASTRYFSLMLVAGMFFGTYSSIFLASPMLVMAEGWQKKKIK